MNKTRRVLILCLISILIVGVSGCSIYQWIKNDDSILNERQKKILSEAELPTDYDELQPHQQSAIVAIDELLDYVEDKYGIGFEYLGYVPDGILESEHLLAYPSGGSKTLDIVKVEWVKGEITDDYVSVVMRSMIEKVTSDFVSQYFDKEDFKVFTETPYSDLDSLPIGYSDLSGNFDGASYIFINGGNVTEKEYDKFIKNLAGWVKKNRYYGWNNIMLIKKGTIDDLTENTYNDFFGSNKILRDKICSLHSDGEMKIWEKGE